MYKCSFFSTSLPTFAFCGIFYDNHSDRCEVIFHCGFDLHFSHHYWCWTSFHVPVGHLYIFFGKISIHIFCHFLTRCFFGIQFCVLFVYFDINPLLVTSFANIFFHLIHCLFILFLLVPFAEQKILSLIRPHFFVFAFVSFDLGDRSKKKYCCNLCQRVFCLCFLTGIPWFLVLYLDV